MKDFSGEVLFLDRSDINTDEIIPAKYLTENTKEALKPYLLEDIILEGFDPSRDIKEKSVVITRANFGCGSSREHAPWAFEVNNINLIIGEGFARIFKQNMFNCGMMAVELAPEQLDHLFKMYANKNAVVETDFKNRKFTIKSADNTDEIDFNISDFGSALVEAGGWVDYADANY